MKKFIFYLRIPFQDIFFRMVFIILTSKLVLFTYSNNLEIESFFPAFGAIFLFLAFSLFIRARSPRIIYLLGLNLLTSIILFSNSLYVKYFNDYATLNNLNQIQQLPFVAGLIIQMSHKELLYFADVIFFPLLLMRSNIDNISGFHIRLKALILIFILALYLNSESLMQLKKLTIAESISADWTRRNYVEEMGIINYQITDALFYFRNKIIRTEINKEDVKTLQSWISSKKREKHLNELTATGKGMNVIVIQVESMQAFVINKKWHGADITPNLNALLREGMYFRNIYDHTGYGNSSDATLLANASLYPARNGAAAFFYAEDCFDSLPKVLSAGGYTTAAMHANVKRFWNSDVFEKSLGFDRQYYKDDFIAVDKIGWGISDIAFFDQSVKKIKDLRPPFYAFLRTLSSHAPFDHITKDIDSFPLYELEGEPIGHYIRAMHYADKAIGVFLRELSENNLEGNTVITVYGDHRARVSERHLLQLGITDTEEITKIPLIIYIPGRNKKEERYTFGGLIDVTPTICNIMGIDISSRYFLGKDLGDSRNSFVIFRDGSYIPHDGSIDRITAQKELQLSDMILEKDVIPLMSNNRDCH